MAALAALGLGGCLTDQVVERPPGRGIAEVSESDPRAAQANIDSLSDVIRRNPSSPEAYNTRGVGLRPPRAFPGGGGRLHPGDPARSQ